MFKTGERADVKIIMTWDETCPHCGTGFKHKESLLWKRKNAYVIIKGNTVHFDGTPEKFVRYFDNKAVNIRLTMKVDEVVCSLRPYVYQVTAGGSLEINGPFTITFD